MLQTYVEDVKRWAARPYKQDGNVLDWFLFFGLVILVTVAWSTIIKKIVD